MLCLDDRKDVGGKRCKSIDAKCVRDIEVTVYDHARTRLSSIPENKDWKLSNQRRNFRTCGEGGRGDPGSRLTVAQLRHQYFAVYRKSHMYLKNCSV
jgi:hypothetical protein